MEFTNHLVSKEEDQWLQDRFENECRWIAILANGERIIQDDYRPGVTPESAWLRLKRYCLIEKTYIVNMYLQFRSHIEHVPANQNGYYFCRAVLGSPFDKNIHMYNVGTTNGGDVHVVKWRTPELIQFGDEIRPLEECKDFIIWRQE